MYVEYVLNIQYNHKKNILNIQGVYMAVRKPLEKVKEEMDIEALIDSGAKVKEDIVVRKKWPIINLRISEEMLRNVDHAVSERVGITRTGWILEAIHEKLKGMNEKS